MIVVENIVGDEDEEYLVLEYFTKQLQIKLYEAIISTDNKLEFNLDTFATVFKEMLVFPEYKLIERY